MQWSKYCKSLQEYITVGSIITQNSENDANSCEPTKCLPSRGIGDCSSKISVGVTCHEKTCHIFLFGHNN